MECIFVLIIEDSKYAADLNIREIRKTGLVVNYEIVMDGIKMSAVLTILTKQI